MPRLSSDLRERASGPQRTTAPKTEPIMVAGPAGKGPAGEVVEIEDEDDAFNIFGTKGPLAYDIAAALRGAKIGSQVADNRRFGRVKAVRTETGESAKLVLTDGNGNDVLELETASSGEKANDWSVVEQNNQYTFEDPEAENVTTFAVDSTAIGVEDTIATPSEFAAAIRQAFNGRLKAEAKEHEAHFEVSLDDSVSAISIDSTDTETTIDFSGVTNSEMQSNSSGSTTWLGGKSEYFSSPSSTMEAHRRVLSPNNEDARIYAITAGDPVAAPGGNKTVEIPNLADASVVGVGDTDTLLNIRTTGAGSNSTIPLTDAAERSSNIVSEGYFRARQQYAGRLDVTDTTQTDMATITAKVASQSDFDLSTLPKTSISVDSTSLSQGDNVLLKAQDDSSENGYYKVIDASGDLDLDFLQDEQDLTNEKVEISSGTDSGQVYTFDADSGDFVEPKAIKLTFDAPAGIADDAGTLTEQYVKDVIGISSPTSSEKAKFSTDRLTGENSKHFFDEYGKAVKLELAPAADEDDLREVDYSTSSYDAADSTVSAKLTWSDGTAELLLDRSEFHDLYGSELDDGFVFFSYDSCVTDLHEVNSEAQLNPNADRLEYAVDEFEVTFNQELSHDLVVRGLTIHQYRLGQDVELERTDTGNKFIFLPADAQPGEGGDKIGKLETIVGFDYTFEPDFPTVPNKKTFSGGSTGVNASMAEKKEALDEALKEMPSEDFAIIVPSGLPADAMTTASDPVTGKATDEPVGVVDVLEDHRDRQDHTGASGVAFLDVSEMDPSDASGAYSSDQKAQRAERILGTGGTGETTAGSIIQEESRPQFYFFDAPFAARVAGRDVRMGGAALFAGIRAALPNDTALYEVELPTDQYRPLYVYDVERGLPERLGNEGRVNTWDIERGVLSLATEVTGGGQVQNAEGATSPSNLQSGVVMFATQQFRTNLQEELSNLIGGMQAGGVETLRATAESLIRGTVNRTRGVTGLHDFEPQKDIQIQAEGGSSIGLYIDVQAVVMGELTRIDLTVGSITQTEARAQGQERPIPQAQ